MPISSRVVVDRQKPRLMREAQDRPVLDLAFVLSLETGHLVSQDIEIGGPRLGEVLLDHQQQQNQGAD